MKTFALAAAVGLLLTTGSADAQLRSRSGYSYSAPADSYYSYGAPSYYTPSYSYSTPSYYTPTYSSGVVTSGYVPYSSSVVVPLGGYSSYYTPGYTYATPSVLTYPSYSSGYSTGVYAAPSVEMYRGRGRRW